MISAKEFLKEAYLRRYGKEPSNDSELAEYLVYCNDKIHSEEVSEHRWWIETLDVTNIEGRLVGYGWGKTTGDNALSDLGWEFDWGTVGFVKAKQVTTTVYDYEVE